MDAVTERLFEYYEGRYKEFGATPKGIGWRDEYTTNLRYHQMLKVIPDAEKQAGATLLDVGSGFGGLLGYAQQHGYELNYTGVDICASMLEDGRKQFPNGTFVETDVFHYAPDQLFDYVVCNGILTYRHKLTIREMDQYAQRIIHQMFALCKKGIAFNMMTTNVDYMEDTLYYRNPVDIFGYCYTSLSPHIRFDHTYPLYEYTVYVYKEIPDHANGSA